MVDDEHAWQQFDFVAEQLKRNGSRQERRIHEDTAPEGHRVWNRAWLVEKEGGPRVGQRGGILFERNRDVG